VVPTGPWFAALRGGDFSVSTGGSCHGIVNPVLDVQPWLPRSVSESNYGYYEDPKELDIYEKMLHEMDLVKQRALMLQYNERVLDEEARYIHSFWWNRLVPLRSYVHGWKIGPSHYANQDLGTIWLSAPECGTCSAYPTMEKAEVETGKEPGGKGGGGAKWPRRCRGVWVLCPGQRKSSRSKRRGSHRHPLQPVGTKTAAQAA